MRKIIEVVARTAHPCPKSDADFYLCNRWLARVCKLEVYHLSWHAIAGASTSVLALVSLMPGLLPSLVNGKCSVLGDL